MGNTMPPAQPNMGVIVERIANIQADVSEIKTLLTCHIADQAQFEQETLSSQQVNAEKMMTVQEQVKDHEERLKGQEDIVRRLAITDAILRWVAVAFMTSAIAFIWSILTHQVVLGFP